MADPAGDAFEGVVGGEGEAPAGEERHRGRAHEVRGTAGRCGPEDARFGRERGERAVLEETRAVARPGAAGASNQPDAPASGQENQARSAAMTSGPRRRARTTS
ncbi:hypothetical protein ABZY09_29605 [Streptomyces sp. NPDC002928]|uniref:hypothetical protein n=1 Tax=Streptomyces sp. NPDC002928 TaxID=3154440 RepID=UPI0033A8D8D4